MTVGHYIDAMDYCRIPFAEVPKEYLTREFFLHTLSKEEIAEIYKKLGITILSERDNHYYNVLLPDNLSVQGDGGTYFLIDGNKKFLM